MTLAGLLIIQQPLHSTAATFCSSRERIVQSDRQAVLIEDAKLRASIVADKDVKSDPVQRDETTFGQVRNLPGDTFRDDNFAGSKPHDVSHAARGYPRDVHSASTGYEKCVSNNGDQHLRTVRLLTK